MKHFRLLVVLIVFASCKSENKYFQEIESNSEVSTAEFLDAYNKATWAIQDSNTIDYLKFSKVAYDYAPTNPDMRLLYASALIHNKKENEARKELTQLVQYQSPYIYNRLKNEYHRNFDQLSCFDSLFNISKQNTTPINNSTIAYILEEKGITPEGVAYDKQTKTLFISSIYMRKIISIDSLGIIRDFIPSGYNQIQGVIGMEVDSKRRILWACSAWSKARITPDNMDKYSGVYKFNLETGELIKKYLLKDTSDRLINDITIHSNGTPFITESLKGKVYMIQPEIDSLELFIDSDHYYYANGITLSDDDKYLFIAHYAGIDIVNLEKLSIRRIQTSNNMTLSGIDGLAYYKNTLIAHQSYLGGVFQYYLNETKDSIIYTKVIERSNPYFEIPTTGEITENEYCFIANSQLRRFDESGIIFPDDKLDPVYILKTDAIQF